MAVGSDAQPAANVTVKNPAKDKQPKNPKYATPGERRGYRPNGRRLTTTQDVKVEPNACLLCGSLSHSYRQNICPYFGTPLQNSECKNCFKGM